MASKQPEIQKLFSKRNDVVRILRDGDPGCMDTVVKTFAERQPFLTELRTMGTLKSSGMNVPQILISDEEELQIVYSFIGVETLLDLLERESQQQFTTRLDALCRWLLGFYTCMKEKTCESMIIGDAHLRNFVIGKDDDAIYGVDFEECRPGEPETDIARLCVFLTTYSPAYTDAKKRLARHVIQNMEALMPIDHKLLRSEMLRELNELAERRNCEIYPDVIEEILR